MQPSDTTVRAVPPRGRLGPFRLSQLLAAEAAVLAVVAGLTRGPIPTLIAALLAAALLLIFFSRREHRWWTEHRLMSRALRLRRAARLDTRAGPILALLRTVGPGLTVRDLPSTDDGPPTGVARDDAGWFSIVALDPATGPVPLDALVTVLGTTDQPGLVLELVTTTIPAPNPEVHPASPAASSYRQLLESTPIPAFRETSISVRVDARTLAEALLDHSADPESAAALSAALARRVVTSLRRTGITGRVLTAAETITTLARSCDIEPGSPVDETWTHWRSARLVHRTYWLKTWPAQATEIAPLFAWAATAPAAQTSVALILKAAGPDVSVRAFIRLATHPDTDTTSLEHVLLNGARDAGAELHPLDGEQGPATYATAPTGGGAG
ncbi:type VII secretion protein EccE [Actinoplanes sp. NPDC051861]|uniref:type VII secretion protein EccE n=1 Tax=Actinoplanes sp. NPDC051861 TaxID=3155170 RepID=UPI00342C44A9